jgi:hypothetical protein
MTVFNFFVVMSGAVAAGIAAVLQGDRRLALLGVVLGLLLTLISFVFWKLDQRVAFLIKHSESALSDVEQDITIASARIFLLEPTKFEQATANTPKWARYWTYGRAFRFVFCIMGLVGLAGAVLSALKAACLLNLG